MPDGFLNQPHAKLFRTPFSDPRNAATAFLRHRVKGSCIGWGSLSLLSGSFSNDQMRGFEADLLFLVKIEAPDALVPIL